MMTPITSLALTILIALLAIVVTGNILKSWLLPIRGKAAVIDLAGRSRRRRQRSTVDRGVR